MSFNKDNYHWTEQDCTAYGTAYLGRRFREEGLQYTNIDSNIYVTQRMGDVKVVFYMTFTVKSADQKEYKVYEYMSMGGREDLEIEDGEVEEKCWSVVEEMKRDIKKKYGSEIVEVGGEEKGREGEGKVEGEVKKPIFSSPSPSPRHPTSSSSSSSLRHSPFSMRVTVKSPLPFLILSLFDPSLLSQWSSGGIKSRGVQIEKQGEVIKRLEIEEMEVFSFIRYRDIRYKGRIAGREVFTMNVEFRDWKGKGSFILGEGEKGSLLEIKIDKVPSQSTDGLRKGFNDYYFGVLKRVGMVGGVEEE